MYVNQNMTQTGIAKALNDRGVQGELGKRWNLSLVKTLLTNEKYIGNLVFNRRSFKLKSRLKINEASDLIRRVGAFPGIVPRALFLAAQEQRIARRRSPSDEELLFGLHHVLSQYGKVNTKLMAAECLPNAKVFASRFGSLGKAYALAGVPATKYTLCEQTKYAVRQAFDNLFAVSQTLAAQAGGAVRREQGKGTLRINGSVLVKVTALRQKPHPGSFQWTLDLETARKVDFVIAACLDARNKEILHYYLIPPAVFRQRYVTFNEHHPDKYYVYRRPSMQSVFGLDTETALMPTREKDDAIVLQGV